MEQLQIHSRSYIARWVDVKAGESISWTLQPHKKSLNFGIFKHPGGTAGATPTLPSSFDVGSSPAETTQLSRRNSKDGTNTVIEKLQSVGLKCVSWTGKCEADQVSMGTFDVRAGEEGMYALVFDNTFSKTVSKTATFVLLTHDTNAPPKSGAQLRYSNAQATVSSSTLGKSPSLPPTNESTESIPDLPMHSLASTHKIPRRNSALSFSSSFFTGVMHKKRRKKAQGYARRFFSLDFTTATLSYYRNSHASALRGSIPLSLASIGADENRKEFTVDSGAEVWHLRLRNKKDFDAWQAAFERATAVKPTVPTFGGGGKDFAHAHTSAPSDPRAIQEWQRVEELVGRISGTRDAVRRLAQDTSNQQRSSPGTSPSENPYFAEAGGQDPPKLAFWKRKPSSGSLGGNTSMPGKRSISMAGLGSQSHSVSPPISIPRIVPPRADSPQDVHRRCAALLRDLDATLSDFSSLLAECKARRPPPIEPTTSRMSFESTRSDDFFDAEDGSENTNQILAIRNDIVDEKEDFDSDEASVTSSDGDASDHHPVSAEGITLFPVLPKALTPTSVAAVPLRDTVAPPRQAPPSIIGFLRKNAGKDMSTVAMPVTANEPTSMLQRLAEPMESADLLSEAAALTGDANEMERLVLISAFAVSALSSNRIKERAVRKPFNPMLGETYELIRHENNDKTKAAYRFIAEKVTHHPVRMAWQANSLAGAWSLSHSPRPVQKFWGKSMELITDGKVRLTLHAISSQPTEKGEDDAAHAVGEHYSWTQPTAYVRNLIAGEKYVEPSGSMTITNETTGAKAVAVFKASGMFSGRSEDVTVSFYRAGSAAPLPLTLTGKWTTSLTRSDTGAEVWRAGPTVPDAHKVWGFPVFSAQLNELTPIEEGRLAPTDSRLRPDQRAFEDGQLDRAEALKAKLEERQRSRRKVLETHGGTYVPRFFQKVEADLDGEEVWQLKTGKDGYWECRERGEWKGVPEVFEV